MTPDKIRARNLLDRLNSTFSDAEDMQVVVAALAAERAWQVEEDAKIAERCIKCDEKAQKVRPT